jgi:hypothetical protein
LERIADAPSLSEKRKEELMIVSERRASENKLVNRIKDGYGLERIDSMEAEIRAEYAAKMADEESEEVMKDNNTAGDMETIERLRQENG